MVLEQVTQASPIDQVMSKGPVSSMPMVFPNLKRDPVVGVEAGEDGGIFMIKFVSVYVRGP